MYQLVLYSEGMHMADLSSLHQAIVAGKRDDAKNLAKAALEGQVPVADVLQTLIDAMGVIGQKFQCKEAFVPEMLMAARAMKEAMTILEPGLVKAGIRPEHKAVIGTVQGDLHDIGKNLVAMMWKGANFEVIDLGINVPPSKFVSAIKQHNPAIVGLSALLTTTMPAMEQAVTAIRKTGASCRIVVGGAPVTHEYAKKIGADGYAPDATSAVDLVRGLCGVNKDVATGAVV
jgi:5-methyltetrahydrofolate--homocysteine methyltransferase